MVITIYSGRGILVFQYQAAAAAPFDHDELKALIKRQIGPSRHLDTFARVINYVISEPVVRSVRTDGSFTVSISR